MTEIASAYVLRYLAKTARSNTVIKSSYILFLTKMQKRQSPKMRFAFLISKNTISSKSQKPVIYCSDLKSGFLTDQLE